MHAHAQVVSVLTPLSGVQAARGELEIVMCQDCDDVERKVDNGFVFKRLLRMVFKERSELGMSCRDYCTHPWVLVSSHRSTQ